MKTASNIRLSLRKLLIATLAVGPLAVLPAPVWATIPASGAFTVTNGNASLATQGSIVNINSISDKSVLVWGQGLFHISSGETWNFNFTSSGSVLNKIGYSTTGLTSTADTAIINGALNSNGKVFVLANGNIIMGPNASVNTNGGLVLSTVIEPNDFNFLQNGNLSFSGSASGSVSLATLNVIGDLSVYAANVSTGGGVSAIGNASATISGNAVTGVVAPGANGYGYSAAPTINVIGTNTTAADVNATLSSAGEIIGFGINNAGAGYGNGTASATISGGTLTPYTYNQMAGGSVTGNLSIDISRGAGGIDIAKTGNLTVGGALSLTTNAGAISQTNTLSASAGLVSVNTGGNSTSLGGAVNLNNANNAIKGLALTTWGVTDTVVVGSNITLAASSISGNTTNAGNLSVTSSATGANVIITNGTVAVGGNASFTTSGGGNTTQGGNINIANSSSVGGALSLTANNASVTFNGTGNVSVGSATLSGVNVGNSTIYGNVSSATVTTTGVLTIGNTVSVSGNLANSGGGGITLTGTRIDSNADVITRAGNASVSFNATAGNLTLGNVTNNGAGSLSLRDAGGNITQIGTTTITLNGVNTGNVTINAGTGNATLNNNNAFGGNTSNTGPVLQITANNATINASASGNLINIGTTTTTGNLTLTDNTAASNSIIIGTGLGTSAQSVNVAGNLSIAFAGGNVVDNQYSPITVGGMLNVTSNGAGAVTFNAAQADGTLSPRVSLGQINVSTTGAVQVAETTTLNLGNITAGSLVATSTTGDIVNTGTVTTTGTALLTAGPTANITLTQNNSFGGTVTLNGSASATITASGADIAASLGSSAPANVTLTTTSGSGRNVSLVATANNGAPSNVVVNSDGTIALSVPTTGWNLTATNMTLNATNSANAATAISEALTGTGRIVVSNTATIGAAQGNVLLGNPSGAANANDFNVLVLNQAASTGNFTVTDINGITVSGASGGPVYARAGASTSSSIANPWTLTLGNLNVNSLDIASGNGGGGNTGNVNQLAGTSLHSENTLHVSSGNGTITINNTGNSAGRVELITGGTSGTNVVNYAEDGFVKLGNLTAGGGTITARTGSIFDDLANNDVISSNGTLNLVAANGAATIGSSAAAHTGGTTTSGNITAITINAPSGAASVITNNQIALGAINANSLTVTATNCITQSSPLSIFGPASFTSGSNVTLGNVANNFGPITINETGTNKAVTITENGTMNLRTVSMVGGSSNTTFTATAVNGDIIDSGLAGVILGGTTSSPGTGVVSLTASKGNITFTNPTTEIPTTGGVAFNATNVTLSVLGQGGYSLNLGASGVTSTAGNLTVSSALGDIGNSGNITVTGNAVFQTGTHNVTLQQPANTFGTVKFTGNIITIGQLGDMKIATGSSAIGNATLSATSGNITIANQGGLVTFGNQVSMFASGNITLPKLMTAVGTVTVNANGTKDLSALSQSADLSGKSPVNQGTGAYLAPQP